MSSSQRFSLLFSSSFHAESMRVTGSIDGRYVPSIAFLSKFQFLDSSESQYSLFSSRHRVCYSSVLVLKVSTDELVEIREEESTITPSGFFPIDFLLASHRVPEVFGMTRLHAPVDVNVMSSFLESMGYKMNMNVTKQHEASLFCCQLWNAQNAQFGSSSMVLQQLLRQKTGYEMKGVMLLISSFLIPAGDAAFKHIKNAIFSLCRARKDARSNLKLVMRLDKEQRDYMNAEAIRMTEKEYLMKTIADSQDQRMAPVSRKRRYSEVSDDSVTDTEPSPIEECEEDDDVMECGWKCKICLFDMNASLTKGCYMCGSPPSCDACDSDEPGQGSHDCLRNTLEPAFIGKGY